MAVQALNREEPRPVAVLAALGGEVKPLLESLADRRAVKIEGGAWEAGKISNVPVAVLLTGIGARAARAAVDWILRAATPRLMIATGFAGGLRDDLRAGDIVLGTEVHEPPPPDGDGPRSWEPDPELLESARSIAESGLRIREGRLLTVQAVLGTSALKRSFGERHGALAADMESSGIARAANARDARVLYARAVVDDVDYEMPFDFNAVLTPEGRPRPLRALGALIRRPSSIARIPELRRRALLAAGNLARFVEELVRALPPG